MVATTEISIRFCCTNGHQLRAPLSLAGQAAECPACRVRVVVAGESREPLSDTGAFHLLNECCAAASDDSSHRVSVSPVAFPAESADQKCCPRCRYPMNLELLICPDCRQALESSQSLLKRIYRKALRSLC
jgi:hypothetical protein